MPKSRPRHVSFGTGDRHDIVVGRPVAPARTAAPDLSRTARVRLGMIDWHRANGACVSRTARHFGFSRPTVYRWLERFDGHRLESLEDRSDRPLRRRRPTWTPAQLHAVRDVRERYPRWGKDKLAVLLRRDGIAISVSMVGPAADLDATLGRPEAGRMGGPAAG